MRSIEPSVEPLSETITSKSILFVFSKIERRQFSITFQSFQQIITIDSFIFTFFHLSARSAQSCEVLMWLGFESHTGKQSGCCAKGRGRWISGVPGLLTEYLGDRPMLM